MLATLHTLQLERLGMPDSKTEQAPEQTQNKPKTSTNHHTNKPAPRYKTQLSHVKHSLAVAAASASAEWETLSRGSGICGGRVVMKSAFQVGTSRRPECFFYLVPSVTLLPTGIMKWEMCDFASESKKKKKSLVLWPFFFLNKQHISPSSSPKVTIWL